MLYSNCVIILVCSGFLGNQVDSAFLILLFIDLFTFIYDLKKAETSYYILNRTSREHVIFIFLRFLPFHYEREGGREVFKKYIRVPVKGFISSFYQTL